MKIQSTKEQFMHFDDITNLNQIGGSFDFLKDEPNLYSKKDLIESYR